MQNRWVVVVVILLVLGFFSIMVSGIMGLFMSADIETGNVALIPVRGIIMTSGSGGLFQSGIASSTDIIGKIEDADKDPTIDAIVLEIDSGGGTPVASDEITQAVLSAEKPVIGWIREVGASGAYYIASGCDRIYANRMSITGSIGVIGSYLEFEGLMDDYNVTYRRLVAGELKDMGSPFKEMSEEEQERMQEVLDKMHDIFIDEISSNRNMSRDEVVSLATGEIFLGVEADKNGLVDALGGKPEITSYLEDSLNISVEYKSYRQKRTLFDALGTMSLAKGLIDPPIMT